MSTQSTLEDVRFVEYDELQEIKGIPFPQEPRFRQFIITGPPGSGKTTLISRLGGWPLEGYIDLTAKHWWRSQILAFRPREVHLGFPFVGYPEALAVFDEEWLRAPEPLHLELSRIQIPPKTKWPFLINWRQRFVFEFLLPPAEEALAWRKERLKSGLYVGEQDLSLELIERQNATYLAIAVHFQRSGLLAYVREGIEGIPKRIVVPNDDTALRTSEAARLSQDLSSKAVIGSRLPEEKKNGSLGGLFWLKLFSKNYPRVSLSGEPTLIDQGNRISYSEEPFFLFLGEKELLVHPDLPLVPGQKQFPRDWIVADSSGYLESISGFVRIEQNKTVVFGREGDKITRNFALPENVAPRHVSITNEKGDLILERIDPGAKTLVAICEDANDILRLNTRRLNKLKRIKEIFGGPIEMLDPDEALSVLRTTNQILREESYRPKDSEGQPGAVLDLPGHLTPIILGDLHAQIDNLCKTLIENCFLEAMERNEACLILLGDVVHSEAEGELEEMDSSVVMLDVICRLKIRFPSNFFLLCGTHENFSAETTKAGIPQGRLLRKRLIELRGDEYAECVETFFNQLPYVIRSTDFIACHAAPTRSLIAYEVLVDLRKYKGFAHEVTSNRLRKPDYPTGYSKGDVKRFRKSIGVEKKTPFIVSHTALSPDDVYWLNAGKIKNHHIVHSARTDKFGLFIRSHGAMIPLEYRAEPVVELINQPQD